MVSLTVHRSTQEIGGNCIEVRAANGERLILDVGRPLDAAADATDLLPQTLDTSRSATVLVSHPHQDHYGLLDEVSPEWPVHCGEATATLMRISAAMVGKPLRRAFIPWHSGRPFTVGPFGVTPLLTDHSAFDAYMLLVEVDGRRILYSGDFRRHGRKSALVDRLMADPPPHIDVLLLEGTNLGRDTPLVTESELEHQFVELFAATPGRVFVGWSPQNVDRTVTIYRACLRSGRTLVLDLYSAEVLEALAGHGRIPQPDWARIKVLITRRLAAHYRRAGAGEMVDRHARNGIPARALNDTPGKWVCMIRGSLIADLEASGVQPGPGDAWSWSLWSGYLDRPGERLRSWFDRGGSTARHIHISGHASVADLKGFAAAMAPGVIVPIHGAAWDASIDQFSHIRRLADGEEMGIEKPFKVGLVDPRTSPAARLARGDSSRSVGAQLGSLVNMDANFSRR